jgi:surface protein
MTNTPSNETAADEREILFKFDSDPVMIYYIQKLKQMLETDTQKLCVAGETETIRSDLNARFFADSIERFVPVTPSDYDEANLYRGQTYLNQTPLTAINNVLNLYDPTPKEGGLRLGPHQLCLYKPDDNVSVRNSNDNLGGSIKLANALALSGYGIHLPNTGLIVYGLGLNDEVNKIVNQTTSNTATSSNTSSSSSSTSTPKRAFLNHYELRAILAFWEQNSCETTNCDNWGDLDRTPREAIEDIYGQISDWNTSKITNMNALFELISFDQSINNWNVSNVTTMDKMFSESDFDLPLDKWNVSNVTSMNNMFHSNHKFDQNINDWNVSNVTDMNEMFSDAVLFNQPLNNWNVSNVTGMYQMFENITYFNQPLKNWNVSNVNNMEAMFCSCSCFNQSLENWNVSNVTKFKDMFGTAYMFEQNLSSWTLAPGIISSDLFNPETKMWDRKDLYPNESITDSFDG